MTLSIDGHLDGVRSRASYRPARKRLNDPWANQMEGLRADLKRRISTLRRLIADCDRITADLDREVRARRTVSGSTSGPHRLFDLRKGDGLETR